MKVILCFPEAIFLQGTCLRADPAADISTTTGYDKDSLF